MSHHPPETLEDWKAIAEAQFWLKDQYRLELIKAKKWLGFRQAAFVVARRVLAILDH